MAEPKARYAVFEVYPESAPEDWRERLRESHGSYAISPLHTPEDGKPHYHVIYKHGNSSTLKGMASVIPADVPANGHVELCGAPRNYQRYLCHMDDLDKQQWAADPRDLIETMGGFPLDLTRDFSPAERAEQRRRVMGIVRDNGLTEYADLLEALDDVGEYDLLDYAWNHTVALDAYLRSRRHRQQRYEESV